MTHNQFDIFKDTIEPIKKLIDSLDELYKNGLIYWDLKMDNLFISWGEVMLLDPQIKEWNEDEDIWKLIFSILLLCHHIWDIYWYDEFRKFFLETLWYSKEKLKEYRRSWYDIYKFLVSLHYPKNSKEVAMMHDFYNRMQRLYQWWLSFAFIMVYFPELLLYFFCQCSL